MEILKNYTKENDYLRESFIYFFGRQGFLKLNPVPVNSRVDKSVFLIGSCTSVFKNYFLNGRINDTGNLVVQPCINSKFLEILQSDKLSKFGSFYETIGLMCKYEEIGNMLDNTLKYLYAYCGFDLNCLEIEINPNDEDYKRLVDERPVIKHIFSGEEQCRHKFGRDENLGEITGRTLKIHYNNPNTNRRSIIAAISTYENNGMILGAEMSSTVSSLNMERLNKLTTGEVSVMNDFIQLETVEDFKYAECISVIGTMIDAGMRPNSTKMDGRIMKKYNMTLGDLINKTGKTIDEVLCDIRKFVQLEHHKEIELDDGEIIARLKPLDVSKINKKTNNKFSEI